MSVHKSLVVKSQLVRARNVWTRLERIEKLEEDGKLGEDASIFGLPKVRTRFKVQSGKAAKKAKAEGEEAEAESSDS